MVEPIEGGSQEKIEITPGEFIIVSIPPMPPIQEIQNYDKPIAEQKWERTEYPVWWDEVFEFESEKREDNPNYRDKRLESFRAQEWHRRLNGHWIFIKGKPVYLPGKYYFYLNWWKNDNGYPKFREPDRRDFLFTEYCFKHPKILGYLKIGSRGFGKSVKECSIMVEELTKPPRRRHGAIQSKSKDDAKDKIFSEKMVPSYLELPEFFQPEADHGTKPEAKLSFFRQAVRGKKAKGVTQDYDSELKNTIYPVPAKEKALDGGTYAIIMQDECGKTSPKEEADVYKRWNINRNCVYRDHEKRGMMLGTTTIEEMKEGGAECEKIWKESDSRNLTVNGFTLSGALRYFTPCTQITFFDEYGYPDEKRAKEWHDGERLGRRDDLNSLASYIRKNPYTPEEAFMEDADGCEFNAYLLNKRLEELELKYPVSYFDLEWTNGRDSEVRFEINPNGRFCAHRLPKTIQETNRVERGPKKRRTDGTLIETWRPLNDAKFRIGCDPVMHGVETVDKRVSDSAAYVFEMYDYTIDHDREKKYKEEDCLDHNDYKVGRLKWTTYLPIVEYIYRHDDPDDFFEDMIKLVRFFGCQILIENNKNGIINKFRDRGYGEFIMYRPKETFTADNNSQNTPGVHGVDPIIQQYIGEIKSYVVQHGHRIPFKRLIEDLLRYRRKNIKIHDPTVAFGITLLSLKGEAKIPRIPIDIQSMFSTYNNSGSESTLNNN
jgi:hypothetical protein